MNAFGISYLVAVSSIDATTEQKLEVQSRVDLATLTLTPVRDEGRSYSNEEKAVRL